MNQRKKKAVKALVANYFKNAKDEPYQLTDGQCDIFWAVTNKEWKWVWSSAPSRYGKTEVVAMALIYLAVFEDLKIPVVAGSIKKAEKIMEYVTKHVADHDELYQGLINLDILKDAEKLKVRVAKDALRWSTGGWIYITSIDAKQISKEGESVVGEGGDVVVVEEAGLIKHQEQLSKVIRMPEGEWRKLVMIGNMIERSVFQTAYENPLYHKVRITLDQAVAEGRFTEQELKEKKSLTTSKDWKRYYTVEFPKAGEFAYFKPKTFEYLPNEMKYYGALDPAVGESGKKGSMVGIIVLGQTENKMVYEVESIGDHITPDEAMTRVLNMPYKFKRFGVEDVQFQSYYKKQIDQKSKELGKFIPFVGIGQKRKKEERIESIEPIINTGQVLFNKDSVVYKHMQDYPELEYLDVLDTLEMCLRLMGISGYDPKHDSSRIVY